MGLFSKNDKGKINKKYSDGSFERILRTVQKKKLEQQKRVVYDFLRVDEVKGSIWESKEQYQGKHKKFWK